MCDVNGKFKLCTCTSKVDTSKPHWVLKYNKNKGYNVEHHVVGMFSHSNQLFTPILRRNILRSLNTSTSIFDFDYSPTEGDLLKLCGDFDEYYCEFRGGKWVWLDYFEYIERKDGKFKNKNRGVIEGSRSKLMVLLDEYENLTNTNLYRNHDHWFIEPKNDFEQKLYYSKKKMSQKEVIEMIQEEIKRLRSVS